MDHEVIGRRFSALAWRAVSPDMVMISSLCSTCQSGSSVNRKLHMAMSEDVSSAADTILSRNCGDGRSSTSRNHMRSPLEAARPRFLEPPSLPGPSWMIRW